MQLVFEFDVMEKRELFWLNGWVDEKDLIMRHNRSFLFGDGFFETIRMSKNGNCLLWPFHWNRILQTRIALNFPWPTEFSETHFQELIYSQFPKNATSDYRLKLIFWRQGEGRYLPENCQLAFRLTLEPCSFPWIQPIQKLGLAQSGWIPTHPLSWIKSTSAQVYVAASMERQRGDYDDLILKNQDGFVIEGTYSCLFWTKNGRVFLPEKKLGGIASCMRKFLLKFWEQKGVRVEMVSEKWNAIPEVDGIGFGNGMGVRFLEIKPSSGFKNLLPDFDDLVK